LNIDAFEDPFNYKLNIATGSVGETKPVNVDLVPFPVIEFRDFS
jgi:adenine-specific DNA-methyltransferase